MTNGKHIRKYHRLREFDYSSAATYFITICTHDRDHLFGEVVGDEMILSPCGDIAAEAWIDTIEMRRELIPLAFVVMPNHVHALFALDPDALVDERQPHCNAALQVGALQDGALQDGARQDQDARENHAARNLDRKAHSVSSIAGGYKGAVTRRVRTLLDRPDLQVWQERFHHHVVRTQGEYDRVFEYVWANPERWAADVFNPENHAPGEY